MAQSVLTAANDTACPTPDKLWFEDEKSAKAAARVQGEKFQKPHRAYPCDPGCGLWHLTTKLYGDFRAGHLTERPQVPASLLLELESEPAPAALAVAPDRRAVARRSQTASGHVALAREPAADGDRAKVAGCAPAAGSIQGAGIDDLVRFAAASGDKQCEAIAARMRRDAAFLYTLLEDLAAEAQDEEEAAALREQLDAVEGRLRDSRAARAVRHTAMADGKAAK